MPKREQTDEEFIATLRGSLDGALFFGRGAVRFRLDSNQVVAEAADPDTLPVQKAKPVKRPKA